MANKPKFLDKVEVANFAYSQKRFRGRESYRDVKTFRNKHEGKTFTIIGSSHLNIGHTRLAGGEKKFITTSRRQVYIVANNLNKKYRVLPEDIILIEEAAHA